MSITTLKPKIPTKQSNGVDLLRNVSKCFLIMSQFAGILGVFWGIIETSSWRFSIWICAILAVIFGYLVRGVALCLATITENSEKKI